MFLHHFNKKENNHKKKAKYVYSALLKIIEEIISNQEFSIKKDFNSSFEIMTIYLFAIFFTNKKYSKKSSINQYLMNL